MSPDGYHERYARLEEIPAADLQVPRSLPDSGERADWLGPAELREARRWRNPARNRAWLAGRWLAKELIRSQPEHRAVEHKRIEIVSTDGEGRSVRPTIAIDGVPGGWCCSISHSSRGVLAAISKGPDVTVGVDLTEVQRFCPGFLSTWFTGNEQAELAEADAEQIASYWAVKEAFYKAANQGEPFRPLGIEVQRGTAGEYSCHAADFTTTGHSQIRTWEVDGQIAVAVKIFHRQADNTANRPAADGRIELIRAAANS